MVNTAHFKKETASMWGTLRPSSKGSPWAAGDPLDPRRLADIRSIFENQFEGARIFSCHLICALGLVIRTFDPHMFVYPDQPSRLVGMRGDFQRKGSACSNLSSIVQKQPSAASWSRVRPALRRAVKDLEDRFVSLADNELGLADAYKNAVHVAEQDRSRGAALAAEEEHVLRCLGAAVIMQWSTLPTALQREVFDSAGSMGKLLETAAEDCPVSAQAQE
jgi:hypothetical protein